MRKKIADGLLARLASQRMKSQATDKSKCPDKVEAPSRSYVGDKWDQALSRLWRTGLV
jgi:hypothetical protein